MNANPYRKRALAWLQLVAIVLISFALIHWFGLLIGASTIFIGVETIVGFRSYLRASRLASRRSGKPADVFGLGTEEETIISTAFALAGIASLTGVLGGGMLAGWLAIGAAAAGAANILFTRLRPVASSDKS
jgi:hypothetical protein